VCDDGKQVIEAVETKPSRNPSKTLAIQSAGCPRCGAGLDGTYKYCPNCSYRLRPDLARAHPAETARASTSHRMLAVGGFLGFCALLLLVVLAGLRLFGNEQPAPTTPQRRIDFDIRDVRFTRSELAPISWGEVAWGLYRPGGLTGPLADLLRTVPEPDARRVDWTKSFEPILEKLRANKEEDLAATLETLEESALDQQYDKEDLRDWAQRVRATLQERSRAILPELYRIDDDFSIALHEVTQEEWFAFLVARARKSGKPTPESYFPRVWRRASGDELVPRMYSESQYAHPVTDVEPAAAIEFCNWLWEEQFGADPDLVIDLPTYLEMTRAGRGGSYDNFPWGPHLGDEPAVLSQGLRNVREADVVGKLDNGILGIIGNAAEWVHFGRPRDEGVSGIAAAGWSYLDSARRRRGGDTEAWQTPFSTEDLEARGWNGRAEHIGFRFVVRPAPARPRFVHVEPGTVQFVEREGPLIRPSDPDEEGGVRERPRVVLPHSERIVPLAFSIAANEITNRQYLAFLTAISESETPEVIRKYFLPNSFGHRPHPLTSRDVVYAGVHGDPAKVPWLYEPGRENHPVQGITPDQAQAYAAWLGEQTGAKLRLPTAPEFIRAGRGDLDRPYPWGDNTEVLELICDGRADDWDRAVSLYRFLDRSDVTIAGLCGNLLELVRAPGQDAGYWLAGGCYEFPPESCTLDDFLLLEWPKVWVPIDGGENTIATQSVTGFRLVREESAE
jgi:formylglycine-generating enzyme required for sulfatase activity